MDQSELHEKSDTFADQVHDRFHVIKLLSEAVGPVRTQVYAALSKESVVVTVENLETQTTETLRLLNHLNNGLPGPAFRLDPDDGEIVFGHCIHLGTDGKLDPSCFMDALTLCQVALDRNLPLIPAVALGQSIYATLMASVTRTLSDN